MEPPALSPATTVGPVSLTVADLSRSIEYYLGTVGLELLGAAGPAARLGAGGRRLLELVESPGAAPAPGATGLFHFALLVPDRIDLARWLAHAARDRVALTGMADHFVSEALYLSDPDGHGIEIYADRPREVWDGLVGERMTTLPLDVDDLLDELEDPATATFGGLAPGTVMGHVHLKVADVARAIGFYRDVLGFELMARMGGSAAFLGAGGYHHHLGANSWESRGGVPAPPGRAALRWAAIVLRDEAERDGLLGRLDAAGVTVESPEALGPEGTGGPGPVIRDPSGNPLVLLSAD